MLKVAKFGGSSVAGAEQIKKVKQIVAADGDRQVVVVSAAGKRSSDDHKMTDLLYLCHAHLTYGVSCADITRTLKERFSEIKRELGLSYDVEGEFDAFCSRLSKSFPVDELVSRGEYFTAKLVAEYLGYTFVDAADCIFFSFDGQVDIEKTNDAIALAAAAYGRIIIPGFYGSLPNGRIKVMTRGGGDITGALAAAALNADVYENWTDVSGILMADPRIVSKPKPIPRITYEELRELSCMGASVLQEDSILPVKLASIPLNIRNTNCPDDPGTMIVGKIEGDLEDEDRLITGITGRRNFTILTVRKHGINNTECLRQSLEIMDRFRVSIENITMGVDSFALVISSESLGDQLYMIISELQKICNPDEVDVQDDIALVSVVGRKMTSRPGSSGRIFRVLGEHKINIRTIAQGADELSITVGVANSQFESAIKVLYNSFAE